MFDAISAAVERHKRVDREVVLLQAVTEQALRRTHRRYFESLKELVSPPAA
jgi:hypothetical protein